MADLAELLERVKAATGPDREIDVALWLAMTPGATYRTTRVRHDRTGREWDINEPRINGGAMVEVPEYTASLDAALALVERVLDTAFIDIEVAKRFVGGEAHGRAEICGPDADAYATAATPALALLAALLSALAAQNSVGNSQLTRDA